MTKLTGGWVSNSPSRCQKTGEGSPHGGCMPRAFQCRDRFYFKAKRAGYPARSAYKIMELNERFGIFRPGHTVVDLGCAPGGWLKVGQERLAGRGILVGIDLLPVLFTLHPGSHFIQGDFLDPVHQQALRDLVPHGADWVLSDMSPQLSGIKFRDKYRSFELAQAALEFSLSVLKKGGGFIFKVFPGKELEDFRRDLKGHFEKVVTVLPEATRRSSTEIYIACVGKK